MKTVKAFTQGLPDAGAAPIVPAATISANPLVTALRNASYEVLPFRGTADAVIACVPRDLPVSITMTASKGIDATVELAVTLASAGYTVTPHLAARMFEDADQVSRTVDRLIAARATGAFVVAGDLPTARGPFADSVSLIEHLDGLGRPFARIGVGGYPEGHARIEQAAIDTALQAKAAHATEVVTQLCFTPGTVVDWAREVHADGLTAPIRVGLPGAVTRQKLVRISAGLGLGQSARFLSKQQNLLWRFLLPGGYRPDRLIRGLAPHLGTDGHGLSGFHFFTFNEIARTELWRAAWLRRVEG
ncbi:5,10-methylenetetrahydrofolate reductase [Nakamurella flava]|uniref:Methylenetetrahydrofolate reductase n=1 Tax=Nakamurella flava TaxID=2576308 RepID=A0A4V6CRC2_9ACTN|nr:methylenetetrahydrofolate reductase [Nakamurella flava]TKV56875.1 5,10-methylenetetrahydrofolate reductase [Nakamurella flava]